MNVLDPLDAVLRRRLIPVLVLDDAAMASPLADALVAGGLPVAEVTYRTAAADACLRQVAAHPEIILGAGTVVRAEQVEHAIDAGAQFIVSPGFSALVVRRCRELGVPVIPGVSTPSEVMAALDAGVDTVKFFPAETSGGAAGLAAIAAAFPDVRFVPSGGIDASNVHAYLGHPAVAAVGGSWMAPPRLVRCGEFAQIIRLTAEAVRLAGE